MMQDTEVRLHSVGGPAPSPQRQAETDAIAVGWGMALAYGPTPSPPRAQSLTTSNEAVVHIVSARIASPSSSVKFATVHREDEQPQQPQQSRFARGMPSPARVFVNSPARPVTPSKATALLHEPGFVVPVASTLEGAHQIRQPLHAGHSSSASTPIVGPPIVVDAIPVDQVHDALPHGHDAASSARGWTSPSRRDAHPNYGGEFLYRDSMYYSTRAGTSGVIVKHAVDPHVVAEDEFGEVVRRCSPARSPHQRTSPRRYALLTDADKGIALKTVRCCVFSDHLSDTDFVSRIRFNRTDARRLFEAMTASDSWARGEPSQTSAAHVLLHNCFTEVLRGSASPIDWGRWFNGLSRRRVEEAGKRCSSHVESLGLVLDRNSRGVLVQLKKPRRTF